MATRETIALIELLGLGSVENEYPNSKVFQELEELSCRLYKDYPTLYLTSSRDIRELLPYPFYRRFEACVYEIAYYTAECIKSNKNAYPPPKPEDTYSELGKLLIYTIKIKEQEQKDKADLEAISPPFSDAITYLNTSEYKSFQKSLIQAVDAYSNQPQIERQYYPELWLECSPEYNYWLSAIRSRKQESTNSRAAQSEYEQYLKSIKNLLSELKSRLTTEKSLRFDYPLPLKNFQPDHWCELELPTKQEVNALAKVKIKELVPEGISDFVKWNFTYNMLALPSANYEMRKVPCLVWVFRLNLMIRLNLYLTGEPIFRNFRGIRYPVNPPNEKLGHYYLGPLEWEIQEGFITPTTLLAMLSEGQMELDGIKIISHNSLWTTYEVDGYKGGTVIIHELFRRFITNVCNGKSLSHGLQAAGMIDKMTASLIANKDNLTLQEEENIDLEHKKNTGNNTEVIQMLEDFGYKESEGLQMVEKAHLDEKMSLEDKVQAALKMCGT